MKKWILFEVITSLLALVTVLDLLIGQKNALLPALFWSVATLLIERHRRTLR